MTIISENGNEKITGMRTELVNRIACLEEILRTQTPSTCSLDRIKGSIQKFKDELEEMDKESDIAIIQQMVFEHGLTTL